MALYAWTDIKGGTLEKPVMIARGSKVTRGDFAGMSEADFNAMIEAGSIRDKPFPAPEGYPGSALDHLRDQLADAQMGSSLEEEEAVVELSAVERAAEAEPELPKEEKKSSK